ncbi:ABC transporter permease [Rhizobium sp. GN54]|uniref:ABC transporter permease n=1 Tax=Rhizobium sp. GN54 TaxID=2898150 RepID=UPI001E30F3DB|nr:ABC transporter permease [Rhizobium sp. GN54]MCD2183745.1 ABC transporter permease [Rhizobium sp. GN54]
MTSQAVAIDTSPMNEQPKPRPNMTAPTLLGPATIFVVLGLLAPLALMFRNSFNRYDPRELMVSAFTLENYARFFQDEFYQEVLFRTVWISALSTLICLIAGFPLAYFLVRQASDRLKSKLLILIIVPLLIGNAVRTAAWMLILNDQGMLAAFLRMSGYTGSLGLMYSTTGVVIGLVSVLLPFMVITLHSVLESIDRNLEDAAASLGAGHLTALRRIVLPLALPGILAGTLLCFILSMNAYATPVLIGGPKFHMMAPTVYQQVSKAMNWPFGSALAFILMAVTLALTVGASSIVQRRYRRWAE